MRDRPKIEPGLFDHLIDAEREALARGGRKVGKTQLIRALRGATGLGLRDARRAVDGYLARRGGHASTGSEGDRLGAWIDDLLDAERATASREDRPITKILLIKAIRDASGLGLRDARIAVEDYLKRRGGENLPAGSTARSLTWLAIVLLIAASAAIAWSRR